MSYLNDDCWLMIFRNLPIKDRVKCESVCKRFYFILRDSNAGYIHEKKINFFPILIRNFEQLYNKDDSDYLPCVSGIMERCGKNLEHITFGKKWLSLKQNVIDKIESYTGNLRIINFSGVLVLGNICNFLIKNANTVEVLSLDECNFYDDNSSEIEINNLLVKFVNLQELYLQKNCLPLSNLCLVNRDLKVLDLTYAIYIEIDELNAFLKNHLLLEELYLDGIQILNEESIQLISNLKNLLVLEIGNLITTELPIASLSNIKTLTTLSINFVNSIDDRTLERILHALHNLENLSITHCINIRSYSSLKLAKNLIHLTITHSNTLNDSDIGCVSQNAKLSSLKIQRCPFLTNNGIKSLVTKCPLKNIELIDCPSIADSSLQYLAKSHKTFENISFESCCNVTNAGVKALAKMKNLNVLTSLNISYNKNVDDSAIEGLYRELRKNKTERKTLLEVCVRQTSVTKFIENRVNDKIYLYY